MNTSPQHGDSLTVPADNTNETGRNSPLACPAGNTARYGSRPGTQMLTGSSCAPLNDSTCTPGTGSSHAPLNDSICSQRAGSCHVTRTYSSPYRRRRWYARDCSWSHEFTIRSGSVAAASPEYCYAPAPAVVRLQLHPQSMATGSSPAFMECHIPACIHCGHIECQPGRAGTDGADGDHGAGSWSGSLSAAFITLLPDCAMSIWIPRSRNSSCTSWARPGQAELAQALPQKLLQDCTQDRMSDRTRDRTQGRMSDRNQGRTPGRLQGRADRGTQELERSRTGAGYGAQSRAPRSWAGGRTGSTGSRSGPWPDPRRGWLQRSSSQGAYARIRAANERDSESSSTSELRAAGGSGPYQVRRHNQSYFRTRPYGSQGAVADHCAVAGASRQTGASGQTGGAAPGGPDRYERRDSHKTQSDHGCPDSTVRPGAQGVIELKNGERTAMSSMERWQRFVAISRSQGRLAAIGLSPVPVRLRTAVAAAAAAAVADDSELMARAGS